jgi:hypothetical protein
MNQHAITENAHDPITAVAADQIKQLISAHVACCYPCGMSTSPLKSWAVWCEEAVSRAGNITGMFNPLPRRQ